MIVSKKKIIYAVAVRRFELAGDKQLGISGTSKATSGDNGGTCSAEPDMLDCRARLVLRK